MKPELIVMLTHNDFTVENASAIFEKCKGSKAIYWGFKEKPLPVEEMKSLFNYIRSCGKHTILEVVAYSEQEGLNGAKLALDCGVDILMGTKYYESINLFCKKHNIKYMPFVGTIQGRPSVLKGELEDIVNEAQQYVSMGVYGIDLLGYRYVGDVFSLSKKIVDSLNVPVCIAGSIDSYKKLDEIKNISPWGFTVGSAFFDKKFGDEFADQINNVVDYIDAPITSNATI